MGIRNPWRQNSEEADTDTSRWQWRPRSTWNRQYSRVCRRITQATTHRAWGAPKKKRSEMKSSDKPSDVSKIHRRGGSLEKLDRHGGGTSLPIPTGGSSHRVWIGVRTYHATESIFQLRSDQQNWPWGKRSQDDGYIRPRWTPRPTTQTIIKEKRICKSRRPDNIRFHDDVKRNNSSGTNRNFQWWYQRVETTIRRPQDVGEIKNIFHRVHR